MRCLGITKSFKRCKRNCRIIYCSSHKMQWWGVVIVIATIAGLYQDIIAPIFFKEHKSNLELLSIVRQRVDETDTSYNDIRETLISTLNDTALTDSSKQYLKHTIIYFDSIKRKVDQLSKENIQAIEKGEQINSYQIRGQIHILANNLTIDTSKIKSKTNANITRSSLNSKLKDLEKRLSGQVIFIKHNPYGHSSDKTDTINKDKRQLLTLDNSSINSDTVKRYE